MEKPRVYIHRLADWYSLYMDQENEKYIRTFCDVVSEGDRNTPMTEDELINRMQGCSAVLSLNGIGTEEITERVLRKVGTIKTIVISHWWAQFASLNLKTLGIDVIEGSNANTVAVAEWVLTTALMAVRRLNDFNIELKSGSSWSEPRRRVGMLYGKKIGLVGLGRVGRYVARLFRIMGAEVSAYDKYFTLSEANELGVQLKSLEEIMTQSDIISLHLPVTPETKGLINADYIQMIPDNAIFINSARAAVYDEEAMVEELNKKRFEAYLDVYSEEPLRLNHPFRSMDNVFITPHIAGDNIDMFRLCGRQAIETLKDIFEGKEAVDRKYYIGF